jgi:hypothetical protein
MVVAVAVFACGVAHPRCVSLRKVDVNACGLERSATAEVERLWPKTGRRRLTWTAAS